MHEDMAPEPPSKSAAAQPADTTRSAETAEPTPAAQPSAAERVDVRAVVLTCISLLASKAWEAMGLVPDPATKKIERHLDEARMAIDAAAALVDLIKEQLQDRERRELETMLTNLRLNYVEQRARG